MVIGYWLLVIGHWSLVLSVRVASRREVEVLVIGHWLLVDNQE
ncbi:hypothetical protein [Nostoc sp. UHCC 0302]